MPYNGLGQFVALPPPTYPAVPNTTIRSDYFNAIVGDLMAGLSGAMTRTGQAAMTANLPMGGFKVIGSAPGVAASDLVTKAQLDLIDARITALAQGG